MRLQIFVRCDEAIRPLHAPSVAFPSPRKSEKDALYAANDATSAKYSGAPECNVPETLYKPLCLRGAADSLLARSNNGALLRRGCCRKLLCLSFSLLSSLFRRDHFVSLLLGEAYPLMKPSRTGHLAENGGNNQVYFWSWGLRRTHLPDVASGWRKKVRWRIRSATLARMDFRENLLWEEA